jgi:hypothetical protein
MPKKPHSDDELLARLDASLAEDVLTDVFTDADVAAALREAGGDPDAIGRRGAELAKELLERRRLAWQEAARRKRDRASGLFLSGPDFSRLPRSEMLRQLEQARRDPRIGKPVNMLYHKRKPEDVSDEELRQLLGEVDALCRLDEDTNDDAGG